MDEEKIEVKSVGGSIFSPSIKEPLRAKPAVFILPERGELRIRQRKGSLRQKKGVGPHHWGKRASTSFQEKERTSQLDQEISAFLLRDRGIYQTREQERLCNQEKKKKMERDHRKGFSFFLRERGGFSGILESKQKKV